MPPHVLSFLRVVRRFWMKSTEERWGEREVEADRALWVKWAVSRGLYRIRKNYRMWQ